MVGKIFFFYSDKKKEQINNSVKLFCNPTTEDLKVQSLQSLETLTWNLSTVATNSLGVYKPSWLMLCFTIFSRLLFYNCSEECGEKRGSTIIKLTGVRENLLKSVSHSSLSWCCVSFSSSVSLHKIQILISNQSDTRNSRWEPLMAQQWMALAGSSLRPGNHHLQCALWKEDCGVWGRVLGASAPASPVQNKGKNTNTVPT